MTGLLRHAARRVAIHAHTPACAAARHAIFRPTTRCRSNLAAESSPNIGSDFNELRERSLLGHVIRSSTEGDPDSVLDAMDEFWDTYFNGKGTTEWKLRGTALDKAIQSRPPQQAMELGTYCGYTAVRIGRLLPHGARLVSVEIEPLFAAIASKVVEHAGLRDSVTIEIGSVMDRLPAIRSKGLEAPLNVLLLDHKVSEFLPDVQFLEANGMIDQSTAVLCDWNLYPGDDNTNKEQAPRLGGEFMEYLKKRSTSQTGMHTMRHTFGEKELFTVSTWTGVI
mmetsp:Transcript_22646/g.37417  ORF Transcript_22646/g.37417 Transcript_22646/m.37417 type:complete len:280 (-) Transcript_22646:501-1340(-)